MLLGLHYDSPVPDPAQFESSRGNARRMTWRRSPMCHNLSLRKGRSGEFHSLHCVPRLLSSPARTGLHFICHIIPLAFRRISREPSIRSHDMLSTQHGTDLHNPDKTPPPRFSDDPPSRCPVRAAPCLRPRHPHRHHRANVRKTLRPHAPRPRPRPAASHA
jgi:hypothetical protein